jgi:preprotein translocase subunit SecA
MKNIADIIEIENLVIFLNGNLDLNENLVITLSSLLFNVDIPEIKFSYQIENDQYNIDVDSIDINVKVIIHKLPNSTYNIIWLHSVNSELQITHNIDTETRANLFDKLKTRFAAKSLEESELISEKNHLIMNNYELFSALLNIQSIPNQEKQKGVISSVKQKLISKIETEAATFFEKIKTELPGQSIQEQELESAEKRLSELNKLEEREKTKLKKAEIEELQQKINNLKTNQTSQSGKSFKEQFKEYIDLNKLHKCNKLSQLLLSELSKLNLDDSDFANLDPEQIKETGNGLEIEIKRIKESFEKEIADAQIAIDSAGFNAENYLQTKSEVVSSDESFLRDFNRLKLFLAYYELMAKKGEKLNSGNESPSDVLKQFYALLEIPEEFTAYLNTSSQDNSSSNEQEKSEKLGSTKEEAKPELYDLDNSPEEDVKNIAQVLDEIYEDPENLEKQKLQTRYNNILSIYTKEFNGLDKEQSKVKILEWSQNKKESKLGSAEQTIDEAIAYMDKANELLTGHHLRIPQIISTLLYFSTSEHKGRLLQISTGEGKTVVASLMATIKALQGHKVDIITSNELLAQQGDEKRSNFYKLFHLNSSNNKYAELKSPIPEASLRGISEIFPGERPALSKKNEASFGELNPGEINKEIDGKKKCYEADIVYGDITTFQFDYLRAKAEGIAVLGKRKLEDIWLILDEVDSMIIDNGSHVAKIAYPFPGMESLKWIYIDIWEKLHQNLDKFDDISENLLEAKRKELNKQYDDREKTKEECNQEYNDFLNEHYKNVCLHNIETEILTKLNSEGYKAVIPSHLKKYIDRKLTKWVENAYIAKFIYSPHHQYKVDPKAGIVPIDYKNTGVTLANTVWPDGLHQFLQLKHDISISTETMTSSFISNLWYIKKYKNLFGLTGTLGSDAEDKFLKSIYDLDVSLKIPTYRVKNLKPLEFSVVDSDELVDQLVNKAIDVAEDRAVLIICETSKILKKVNEKLKNILIDEKRIIKYEDEKDKDNIKNKITKGNIIITTNIGARGTDFELEDALKKAGGLHVILGFLAYNTRVEWQAIGRVARQGDPGSAEIIVTEDELSYYGLTIDATLEEMRKIRDFFEAKRLEEISSTTLKERILADTLFEKFLSILNELKKNNSIGSTSVQSDFKEIWAHWLEENLDNLDDIPNWQDETFGEYVENKFKIFEELAQLQIKENKITFNPFYSLEQAEEFIESATVFDSSPLGKAEAAVQNAFTISGDSPALLYSAYTKLFNLTVEKKAVLWERFANALEKVLVYGHFTSAIDSETYRIEAKNNLEKAKQGLEDEKKYLVDLLNTMEQLDKGLGLIISNQELVANIESPNTKFREYLKSIGKKTEDVLGDGNCFFRAVERQLNIMSEADLEVLGIKKADIKDNFNYTKLREKAVEYLRNHKEDFASSFVEENGNNQEQQTIESYIDKMSKDKEWVSQEIIEALARSVGVKISITPSVDPANSRYPIHNESSSGPTLFLGHMLTSDETGTQKGQHYVSVEVSNDNNEASNKEGNHNILVKDISARVNILDYYIDHYESLIISIDHEIVEKTPEEKTADQEQIKIKKDELAREEDENQKNILKNEIRKLESNTKQVDRKADENFVIGSKKAGYLKSYRADPQKKDEMDFKEAISGRAMIDIQQVGVDVIYALRTVNPVPSETVAASQGQILAALSMLAGSAFFPPAYAVTVPIASTLITESIMDIVFKVIDFSGESKFEGWGSYAQSKIISYSISALTFGVAAIAKIPSVLDFSAKCCRKLAGQCKKLGDLGGKLATILENIAVKLEKAAELGREINKFQKLTALDQANTIKELKASGDVKKLMEFTKIAKVEDLTKLGHFNQAFKVVGKTTLEDVGKTIFTDIIIKKTLSASTEGMKDSFKESIEKSLLEHQDQMKGKNLKEVKNKLFNSNDSSMLIDSIKQIATGVGKGIANKISSNWKYQAIVKGVYSTIDTVQFTIFCTKISEKVENSLQEANAQENTDQEVMEFISEVSSQYAEMIHSKVTDLAYKMGMDVYSVAKSYKHQGEKDKHEDFIKNNPELASEQVYENYRHKVMDAALKNLGKNKKSDEATILTLALFTGQTIQLDTDSPHTGSESARLFGQGLDLDKYTDYDGTILWQQIPQEELDKVIATENIRIKIDKNSFGGSHAKLGIQSDGTIDYDSMDSAIQSHMQEKGIKHDERCVLRSIIAHIEYSKLRKDGKSHKQALEIAAKHAASSNELNKFTKDVKGWAHKNQELKTLFAKRTDHFDSSYVAGAAKFNVAIDNTTGKIIVKGRPEFLKEAKDMKASTEPGDRRHVISWELLRDTFVEIYNDEPDQLKRDKFLKDVLESQGLPTAEISKMNTQNKIDTALKKINSNPNNLAVGNAQYNQALPHISGDIERNSCPPERPYSNTFDALPKERSASLNEDIRHTTHADVIQDGTDKKFQIHAMDRVSYMNCAKDLVQAALDAGSPDAAASNRDNARKNFLAAVSREKSDVAQYHEDKLAPQFAGLSTSDSGVHQSSGPIRRESHRKKVSSSAPYPTNKGSLGAIDREKTGVEPWFNYSEDALETILTQRVFQVQNSYKYNSEIRVLDSLNISFNDSDNLKSQVLSIAKNFIKTDKNIKLLLPILIPQSDHVSHWVGMVFEVEENDVIKITYLDSENQTIPKILNEELIDQFQSELPNFKIHYNQLDLETQEYNNCGPELIENFIYYLFGTRAHPDTVVYIHSLLLENSILDPILNASQIEENNRIIEEFSNIFSPININLNDISSSNELSILSLVEIENGDVRIVFYNFRDGLLYTIDEEGSLILTNNDNLYEINSFGTLVPLNQGYGQNQEATYLDQNIFDSLDLQFDSTQTIPGIMDYMSQYNSYMLQTENVELSSRTFSTLPNSTKIMTSENYSSAPKNITNVSLSYLSNSEPIIMSVNFDSTSTDSNYQWNNNYLGYIEGALLSGMYFFVVLETYPHILSHVNIIDTMGSIIDQYQDILLNGINIAP